MCLCQGSVMVLVTPGPQMLLAACARHTDNFLQECVHLKTIEKVNYCKWIFCLSSCCRNPPSVTVTTLPPLFFSQLMNTALLHKHHLPLPYKSPAHRQDHRNKIIRLSETVKGHHGNGVNFMHVIIVFGCNEYLSKKG